MDLPLYWETVRHLKPRQIVSRLLLRLPRPAAASVEGLRRRAPSAPWAAAAPRRASMTGPARVRFLNREREIPSPSDWNDRGEALLWLYNLHYFDDLNAEGAPSRRAWHAALIDRWIAENPAAGGVGWHPYPVSLRIVNWIKWSLSGGELPPAAAASLALQAEHLSARLETHILGNHYLVNAKALVFAGAYFEGDRASRWLRTGLDILREQWAEQILPDGGHFERSPMYHCLALEDALDILNVLRACGFPAEDGPTRKAAFAMLAFLPAALHPDGRIAFFNDGAFGVAPEPEELSSYAVRLGLAPLSAPGRAVLARPQFGLWSLGGDDSRLIVDAGPVGPDCLPAHAHCDTLSYELSVGRRRLVVNSGTFAYSGPERAVFRSTAAHNTVQVDGAEQHEVWADFRVARRGYPFDVRWDAAGGAPFLSASHTGYARLPGRPQHRRTVFFRDGAWSIEDEVQGVGRHAAASFVHLHPDVEIREADERNILCALGSTTVRFEAIGAQWGKISDGVFSPEFGLKQPNKVLRQDSAGSGTIRFSHRISWERSS
jgi:uncharacterized heparinase superfamily protein